MSRGRVATGPTFAAEGFGGTVSGGAGKTVVHVTNLNSSGAGSLSQALSAGDRYIVFDVGGTISSPAHLRQEGLSNITIDGNTAPSPGITISGAGGLHFEGTPGCSNIIVRSIRVRGITADDCFKCFNSTGVVFDHCSASGFQDGGIDVTQDSSNVTIQWSIINYQTSGDTLGCLISYSTYGVTLHHNILAASERNPLAKVDDSTTTSSQTMADITNNVIWRWGANFGAGSGHGVGVDWGGHANVVNNFFQSYASQAGGEIQINNNGSGGLCYARGNLSGNAINVDAQGNQSTPYSAPGVRTEPARSAVSYVLANAGCRIGGLDAYDKALVDDILANMVL